MGYVREASLWSSLSLSQKNEYINTGAITVNMYDNPNYLNARRGPRRRYTNAERYTKTPLPPSFNDFPDDNEVRDFSISDDDIAFYALVDKQDNF